MATLTFPQPGAPTAHVRFVTDGIADVATMLRVLADAIDAGLAADVALRQLDLVRAALVTAGAGR
jgi:hypothetical protein